MLANNDILNRSSMQYRSVEKLVLPNGSKKDKIYLYRTITSQYYGMDLKSVHRPEN